MLLPQTTLLYGHDLFNHNFHEFGVEMLLHLRYVPTIELAGTTFSSHDSPYLMLYPVNTLCENRGYDLADKERLVLFGNSVLQELGYLKRLHIVIDAWGVPRIRAYRIAPPQVVNPAQLIDGVVIFNGVANGGELAVNDQQLVIFNGDADEGVFLLNDDDQPEQLDIIGDQVLNPFPLIALDPNGEVVDIDGRRRRLLNIAVLSAIADLFAQLNPTLQAPITLDQVHQHVVHTLTHRYGIGPTDGLHLEGRYMDSMLARVNNIEPVVADVPRPLLVQADGTDLLYIDG